MLFKEVVYLAHCKHELHFYAFFNKLIDRKHHVKPKERQKMNLLTRLHIKGTVGAAVTALG